MDVAVLGGGYAGLTVAKRLERRLSADHDIVVVDESGRHLLQHELHRVVRRPRLADAVTVPLADVLSRAEVRNARVTAVDPDGKTATLTPADGGTERLDYDLVVVCLGAETAFHDVPGVEQYAVPLKRLDHARTIRQEALAAPDGQAVVGGAGLSGVQVAGELAALSTAADLGLDVTVVERADRVAPRFDPTFGEALRRELAVRGVTVETGVAVERADAGAVALTDGRELTADVFVWTGGIRGSTAFDGDRPAVGADLRVGDGTFVVGDAGRVVDARDRDVPASAQTAVRQARVAARNIVAIADDSDAADPSLDAYRYDSPGWVASVGDGAVAQVGSFVVSGDAAKAAKAAIAAGHLGSVGAIERASDLVRAELDWPGSDAVALPPALASVLQASVDAKGTDPATPSELQYPLANAAVGLADLVTGDRTVDLTAMTRQTDRTRPGSPANLLGRAAAGPLEAVLSFGSRSDTSGE